MVLCASTAIRAEHLQWSLLWQQEREHLRHLSESLEKTFLEKAFLLHELFTTNGCRHANRKSRHLYDLMKMMDEPFAQKAVSDDELWSTIHHHRELFTSIKDVDYTPDIRKRIVLLPPEEVLKVWQDDYNAMQESMIYGEHFTFEQLISKIEELQARFRSI